jgi:hypothetical protein
MMPRLATALLDAGTVVLDYPNLRIGFAPKPRGGFR